MLSKNVFIERNMYALRHFLFSISIFLYNKILVFYLSILYQYSFLQHFVFLFTVT